MVLCVLNAIGLHFLFSDDLKSNVKDRVTYLQK